MYSRSWKNTHSLHSQGNAQSSSARIETYTGYDGKTKTLSPSLVTPISMQQAATQLRVTKLKMQNVAMPLTGTVTSQFEKKLWEVCGNYIRFILSQAPCLKNDFIPTSVVINTVPSERVPPPNIQEYYIRRCPDWYQWSFRCGIYRWTIRQCTIILREV